jgi:hypothetical protein
MKRLSEADLYPSQHTPSASPGVGGSAHRIVSRLRLPLLTPFLSLPLLGGVLNPRRPADSSRKGRSAVSPLRVMCDTSSHVRGLTADSRLASGQHNHCSSDSAAFDERRGD